MIYSPLQQMLKRFPCQNSYECTRALKEIIQEIALVGLWRAKFFEEAAFYGGTALRILYGLDRFSEDLDFSLLEPNPKFSLASYNKAIQEELESYGFKVTVNTKTKINQTAIESAFIKGNVTTELLRIGIPSFSFKGMHPETHLKVKLEVDTSPPGKFRTEARTLIDPIPVSIKVFAIEDLFAGKMHALLCRLWKERIKGRDWYDFVWFIRRGFPLHLQHLQERMWQTDCLEKAQSLTPEVFAYRLEEKIMQLDVEKAKQDIRPFVVDEAVIADWSHEYFLEFAKRIQLM